MLTKLPQSHALFRFLAVLFFLHAFLMIHAQGLQGGDEKVTINGKNIPLRDVFKSITRQTGLHFFYSPEVVNPYEKVTVDVKQQSVDNVLSSLLANKGLAWVYNDNAIAIREKEQKTEKKRVSSSDTDSVTNPVTITLTGKVTDAEGNAIPGATVLLKGTDKGTNTEADGTFTLPGVDMNSTVIIRSVGYETREIPVKGKSINAKLGVVVNDLDETVVIAYGTTTKRYNTGNVSSVKAKDIEKQPVTNPLLALQGRVPGLFITQSSGLPGSGVTVRIQGQNSIANGNDPFYVIDGVPYTGQLLPSLSTILGGSGSATTGSPLNFINPADIESIDILKDADATAIYGSRAANGAILITTKKGGAGRTKVTVNVQQGWGKVTRKIDLLSTRQYLEMRHEALQNDNATVSAIDYDINGTWDTTRYTDWQRELIGGTAKYTDVQTSVSGGSANTQFLLSTGFHRETTVYPGKLSDRRGSMHFNINHSSSNQKLKMQLSGNYMIDMNKLSSSDLTGEAIRLAPNAPSLYNLNGSLNWQQLPNGVATWTNPLYYLLRKYNNKTNNLLSNLLLSYELIPGLIIKSSLGYTKLTSDESLITPITSFKPNLRPNAQRSASYSNKSNETWIIEPQLNYRLARKFGIFNFLVGTTIQSNSSNLTSFRGRGYNSDAELENIRAASTITVDNSIRSFYKYNAIFGRINYNYNDKYIVNISARRDGSSRFGSENLFQNFGAVGCAWIFSEEKFTKSSLSFLSYGKILASYGTTGSDQIDDYQFLSLYTPINPGVAYQGGIGLLPAGHNNPFLQWESTKELNIGMDVGLLNNRILLNANFSRSRSSNQLIDYKLPLITGFTGVKRNFPAIVQNMSWEFSINTSTVSALNFSWITNFNLTLPRNELVKFPDLEASAYNDLLIVGQPLGITKAYQFAGVDLQTGGYQFTNNEGKITSNPDYFIDRIVLINTNPKFYGGLQNTFTYKNLSLDLLLQFVKQVKPNYEFGYLSPGFNGLNQPASVLGRWQNEGDQAAIQKFTAGFGLFPQLGYAYASNAGYSDASYIRMKNLSLSWQMPMKFNNKKHIQSLRLYMQAQNLFTITNYEAMDPESGASALPPLSIVTLGAQIIL